MIFSGLFPKLFNEDVEGIDEDYIEVGLNPLIDVFGEKYIVVGIKDHIVLQLYNGCLVMLIDVGYNLVLIQFSGTLEKSLDKID